LQNKVLQAVQYLLFPLVRLAIARGLGFGALAELIKFAMIKEAENELKRKRHETISDSRLSIITGIHRKEVKRIRAVQTSDAGDYEPGIVAQVVAKWSGASFLQTPAGPQRLPRKKTDVNDYDFEDLVKSISTDIRPKVVLEVLLDRGLVTMTDEDTLQLCQENLALKQDQEETLHYLSLNVHDHLAASVNNLNHPENKLFDRCVHYHGLSAEAVASLNDLATEEAMRSLLAVNHKAQELIKDAGARGSLRMNFGAYFYHEEITKDQARHENP